MVSIVIGSLRALNRVGLPNSSISQSLRRIHTSSTTVRKVANNAFAQVIRRRGVSSSPKIATRVKTSRRVVFAARPPIKLATPNAASCFGYSTTVNKFSDPSHLKIIQGDWTGTIDVNGMKVPIVLHINNGEDGNTLATIDSPDQGVNDIPIDLITLENQTLTLVINKLQAKYVGIINKNQQIEGTFTQNGIPFPLIFNTGIQLKKRPQEPTPPFPYIAEEVSYENKTANLRLAGTLTLPSKKGPHSAVILITGSGAHDRNETIMGHKPFLVIADHLTRLGIAVLRVDDRGVGQSTGTMENATTKDFAGDVLASIHFLKGRKEINQKKIGLIGHSEGGIIAPMVAAKSNDVAFIILMAGTGMNGEEIVSKQAALIMRAEGVSEERIENNRKLQEQMFSIVKKEINLEAAEKQLRKVVEAFQSKFPMTLESKGENNLDWMNNSIKMVNSPWFRYFLTHDPFCNLKQVKVPVLALNGELDLQVSSKQNLPVISKALQEAGNKDVIILELPKINHLFQTCKTGSSSEYGIINETISPAVLRIISDWIVERTQS